MSSKYKSSRHGYDRESDSRVKSKVSPPTYPSAPMPAPKIKRPAETPGSSGSEQYFTEGPYQFQERPDVLSRLSSSTSQYLGYSIYSESPTSTRATTPLSPHSQHAPGISKAESYFGVISHLDSPGGALAENQSASHAPSYPSEFQTGQHNYGIPAVCGAYPVEPVEEERDYAAPTQSLDVYEAQPWTGREQEPGRGSFLDEPPKAPQKKRKKS
jgi:hypothetical protein